MCNQNSCFGGSSCCWIIIAIILLFLFCGNGCGNGCGCGGNNCCFSPSPPQGGDVFFRRPLCDTTKLR